MRIIIAVALLFSLASSQVAPREPLAFSVTWIVPGSTAHMLYIQASAARSGCFFKVKHGTTERLPLGCYLNMTQRPGYIASGDLPMPSYVDYDSVPAAGDTYIAVEHAPDGTPMGEYTTRLLAPIYLPVVIR